MFIKSRIKHPKWFKFLKEVKIFLFVFVIVFILVFVVFNGRAFYNQVKYSFKIGIEKTEDFLKKFSLDNLYNVPNSIIIPKININAPISFPKHTDEKSLFKELEKGVVHYSDSVRPGKVGDAVLLGHSSAYPWYKGQYGSVFSLLNRLDQGDEIIIFYKKHKYVYKITEKRVVKRNTDVIKQTEKSQIILLSCWPIGTTWNRIMIKGELE